MSRVRCFALVALPLAFAPGCAPGSDTAADSKAAIGAGGTTATDTSGPRVAPGVSTGDTVPGKEVYIDSVRGTNPLTVFLARARTFENTVQVRLRDAAGALIAERFTTSAGEMGHHNPFSKEVWLTREPGARVIVEAFEYSANDGSVRSLTADTIPYRTGATTLHLVFPTSDCTGTATFQRSAPRTVSVARLLIEALVGGPTSAEQSAGARSPFPRGAAVNSVIMRGGEVTVDFNERLQNVGGSCAAQGIRAAVTETLKKLPAVTSVLITAGGSREQALQP